MSDTTKIPCSVGILTFNSETTLRRALESVKDFDDVIACDGGSTDNTLAIAREYGARIISQPLEAKNEDGRLTDFGRARQSSLDAARYDWFLYIDSDESISEELCEDIRRIVAMPLLVRSPLAYKIPIGILLSGRYLKHSSTYPGYQTRFFNKKSGARFVKPVHEKAAFNTGVLIGTLVHPWFIHTEKSDWVHYYKDGTRYRMIASERYKNEPWSVVLYTVYRACRSALGILARSVWIRIRHGSSDAVPWMGELGRIRDQLSTGFAIFSKKLHS